MSETKKFHIGDVLSIVPGFLVATRGIESVYDILGWMTSEQLMTHQLPRASKECEPTLLAAFPWLKGESGESLTKALSEFPNDRDAIKGICDAWVANRAAEHGEWLEVPQLADQRPYHDPIAEAVEMMGGKDGVFVVEI